MKDNKTMKTTSESSPKPPEGSRRLRKGGLSRTMLLATAVAGASTALMTANADIIHSGQQNLSTSSDIGVVFDEDNEPVNIDGADASEFTLQSFNEKGSDFHLLAFMSANFGVIPDNVDGAMAQRLTLGAPIGNASTFAGGTLGIVDNIWGTLLWPASEDGYIGFSFNPSGSQALYGWGLINISGDSKIMTLKEWAYENTGLSITAGAVPEPSTGTLALGGLGAFALWRKRPKATS